MRILCRVVAHMVVVRAAMIPRMDKTNRNTPVAMLRKKSDHKSNERTAAGMGILSSLGS